MFDNYHVRSAPAYPQQVEINNAPAADQAKLLYDLEQEAIGRIVRRERLENSLIKARITVIREPAQMGDRVLVSFTLNGVDISFNFLQEDTFYCHATVVRMVHDRIAQEIAVRLAAHE